jgi:hypothetical protein
MVSSHLHCASMQPRLLLAFLVGLSGSACAEGPLVRPVASSPDEPMAIAAALDSLFSSADEIFVEPRTMRHFGSARSSGAGEEVLRDFAEVTRESAPAPLPLPTRIRSRVFTEDEHAGVRAKSQMVSEGKTFVDMERFFAVMREEHPRSAFFVSFTRAGFNADRTEALVYVTIHCGGLCGSGQYVQLRRTGSRWVVQRIVITWVS